LALIKVSKDPDPVLNICLSQHKSEMLVRVLHQTISLEGLVVKSTNVNHQD